MWQQRELVLQCERGCHSFRFFCEIPYSQLSPHSAGRHRHLNVGQRGTREWLGCQVASGMSLPLCASGFSLVKWDYELDFPHKVVIKMALENGTSAEHRDGPPRK